MRLLFRILGILFCVLPPAISTLSFFPIWMADSKTAVSALTVILLALSALPLFRILKAHLRSPSAWMIWLVLWGFLFAFRPIAPAIETIALISFPTSLLGAVCFRVSGRFEHREGAHKA